MFKKRCRSDRERTTSCATSFYPHKSCKFESRAWQGVLDTTLCHKVHQ